MWRDDSDALRKTIEAQEYPPYVEGWFYFSGADGSKTSVPSVHGGMILRCRCSNSRESYTLRTWRDDSHPTIMQGRHFQYPPHTEGWFRWFSDAVSGEWVPSIYGGMILRHWLQVCHPFSRTLRVRRDDLDGVTFRYPILFLRHHFHPQSLFTLSRDHFVLQLSRLPYIHFFCFLSLIRHISSVTNWKPSISSGLQPEGEKRNETNAS